MSQAAETVIRGAMPADAAGIAAIYAHHVRHGTGTFEETPPDAAEIARRIADVTAAGWPWLVAERDGTIVGYAYAAQFNPRSGYRRSCEDSIYVAADAGGGGIGGALLSALLPAARAAGFSRMFAVIGDAANTASIALHARAGFRHVGRLEGIGLKFGRELDVIFMQRSLD